MKLFIKILFKNRIHIYFEKKTFFFSINYLYKVNEKNIDFFLNFQLALKFVGEKYLTAEWNFFSRCLTSFDVY